MAGSKGSKTGGSTASTKTGGSTTGAKTGGTQKGSGGSSGTKVQGSSKEVMKAPGQDSFMFRKDFEQDPKSYFKGLRD